MRRSTSDRWIAGVAGGIAKKTDLDANVVRVLFVALALFGGSGLLVYILLAVLVPADDAPPDVSTGTLALRGMVVLLVLVAAALLGIGAGVAAAFGAGTAMAIIVILLGAALVIGGLLGGARWLIAPALLLAVPLAIVTAAGIDLRGGVGKRDYRPASMADLKRDYKLGAGELRLDLSDLKLPQGSTPLKLHVGVGHAIVQMPADACLQSDVHIGAGEARILGRANGGLDVDVSRSPALGDRPVLVLDGDVGLGQLEVSGAPAVCA